MIVIQICIGSSCHLKGSREIVDRMKRAIAEHGVEGEVALGGSFCLGKCSSPGVCVTFDGEVVSGVTPENFNGVFRKYVLTPLGKGL